MLTAFPIAGYGENTLEQISRAAPGALQYGAPPTAPSPRGIDRIVMLLCGRRNLREVTLFPMKPAREASHGGDRTMSREATARAAHIRLNLQE